MYHMTAAKNSSISSVAEHAVTCVLQVMAHCLVRCVAIAAPDRLNYDQVLHLHLRLASRAFGQRHVAHEVHAEQHLLLVRRNNRHKELVFGGLCDCQMKVKVLLHSQFLIGNDLVKPRMALLNMNQIVQLVKECLAERMTAGTP